MTLLIFDCDGTLVDSEFLHAQAETDLLKEKFGIVHTIAEHSRYFCGAGPARFYKWIEERIGQPLPADFSNELTRRKNASFQEHLRAVPYMQDALRLLEDTPKCVASNSLLETINLSLRATRLFDFFAPHVFSAQMVAHGKPAPDLFLYAAQRMNAAPQDCVVIEDSSLGVEAALSANMRVFGYTGGGHCHSGYEEKLQKAELLFDDMRDLPRLLGLS